MQEIIKKQENSAPIFSWLFISIFFANMAMNLSKAMSNAILALYADSLGIGTTIIGVLMSIFAVSALLFKVISAPAIDTYNKKNLFFMSMIIMTISSIGYSLSHSVELLMLFRILQGCGQAFGNVCCLAMVAEFLPKEKYGVGMGYYSLTQVVSQAAGPTLGLWLMHLVGYNLTFLINAFIMLVAAMLGYRIKYDFKRTRKFKITWNNIFAKEALLPAVLEVFIMMSFYVINSFLIIFAHKNAVSHIGLFFIISAATMVFSRPLVGKLTDKYGLVRIFIPSLLCDVIAFFIIGNAQTLLPFLLAAFISAFGFGACQPVVQSLAMKCVPSERRGVGGSTNCIGMDIGVLLGPVIAGAIAEQLGYVMMWHIMTIPLIMAMAVTYIYRRKIIAIEENFSK
ncbi:MFS transporter [Pectinatus brassicae]|uniref:MFS family permease n=1 Tax=Pectinatus brassicae TaxID=862415 RepID=A0A840UM81_9FIRM|nr:MFS transporter [Pectinatus brassicae]MBB5336907.1 MFS family permease [Pectinatus brassicae]